MTSNGTDSKSKFFRRSKIFAQWYRNHPETLFTTYQQKFDLMYTGRYSYASVSITNTISWNFNESNFSGNNGFRTNKCFTHSSMIWTRRPAIVKSQYPLLAWTISFKVILYSSTERIGAIRMLWETSIITTGHYYVGILYIIFIIQWRMQGLSDFGLVFHWLKSYQPSTKGCLLKDYKKNAPAIRVLNLKDLSSAFLILLLGCSISFLAFLIEKIRYYKLAVKRR